MENIRSNPEIRRAINLCWLPIDPKTLLHWLYKHPELLKKVAKDFDEETRNLLYREEKIFSDNDVAIIDYLDVLLVGSTSNIN